MKVVILFVIYNRASKTCELPILMMLGSGPNLGNKFFTKNFLLLAIFGSLVLNPKKGGGGGICPQLLRTLTVAFWTQLGV